LRVGTGSKATSCAIGEELAKHVLVSRRFELEEERAD
jgi:hypothetical protein